ncbi:hypothetical protein F511_36311 [Dorcoceras hygrometricum]|uniref:Dystroglycan-like n=1 Tax=Dorcoceras hygrometricum TaxID=472368 RepID=A0A2Z7AQB1_9LAMI|nr:hypothetical protein F511_36311 [Dorcoceras hygrometricum]
MASSLISRSHHIDFDSIFRFDDAEIVQMFESLITTGLKEFLGCPAIFHENALTEFFANGSVRDGVVVSTIGGIPVEISESVFAATFGLPTEGLTDLSEVPRNLLSDAQSLFSVSEKEVSISCLKKEIMMQYRLLSDILAKSLFVKAGSFDAVTRDRFLLMTAITFDVKVNWGNLLFGVLKEMVTPDSRLAKGYAIQICVLLKNIPGLELGESRAFPAPRILNEKTVHRIVSVNENVGVEEVGEAPRAKKTPVKKTMSKKRQAAGEAEVAPVIKKKRSTKGKPVAARRISLEKQVENSSTSDQPVVGVATREQIPLAGVATGEKIPATEDVSEDADATIKQVLSQLDLVFEEPDEKLYWQSTQMNDLKKGLMAPVDTIFQDLFDIKKNQRAQEAKLNALDGQVAAIRNEQLEFQSKISADLLSLSTQFADIVDYIRGGDAKKGEGGSSSRPPPVRVERRPLPTPQSPLNVAGGSSAVRIPTFPRTTGTFAERTEQARRHILESGQAIILEEAAERIHQADIQESDIVQRERDRARREKRGSSSKRRRGF